jgi:hypothetical protein
LDRIFGRRMEGNADSLETAVADAICASEGMTTYPREP